MCQACRVLSVAVVAAVGVDDEGRREVPGMDIGPSETEAFWTAFLRGPARGGRRGVRPMISDAREVIGAAADRPPHCRPRPTLRSKQRTETFVMDDVLHGRLLGTTRIVSRLPTSPGCAVIRSFGCAAGASARRHERPRRGETTAIRTLGSSCFIERTHFARGRDQFRRTGFACRSRDGASGNNRRRRPPAVRWSARRIVASGAVPTRTFDALETACLSGPDAARDHIVPARPYPRVHHFPNDGLSEARRKRGPRRETMPYFCSTPILPCSSSDRIRP
ncbi:transposase [Rhodoplanes sp. TEM]|uniref:transposase n=1 Tax=Rhodoplanes sp. TEM TaxID=3025489 RepID=UPI003FA7DFDA